MPVARCSSTAAAGSICGSATSQARRSAALSFVELAHPDRHAGNRPKRRREYRPIVQAMAFGQGYRLYAALRVRSRARQALSGKLGERDTRPRGTAGRSPGRARRPRKGAARRRRIAETTSRRSRDSSARLPEARYPSRSDRSIRLRSKHRAGSPARSPPELTATPCQRQPQRRDGHRRGAGGEPAGALWTWDSASAS